MIEVDQRGQDAGCAGNRQTREIAIVAGRRLHIVASQSQRAASDKREHNCQAQHAVGVQGPRIDQYGGGQPERSQISKGVEFNPELACRFRKPRRSKTSKISATKIALEALRYSPLKAAMIEYSPQNKLAVVNRLGMR